MLYIFEIQTAKFSLLWYCVYVMYMCPYSIPERIYAHLGFSVGNYCTCMWTWGALVRRIWTIPWCVKNIFLSNHPCMCWRKRFGINFNIFKRSFLLFWVLLIIYAIDSAFSHSESVGWRYVISASALYYAFWSKTTKQIILYSIIVELIVIFFSTVSRYLILFHDMW